MKEEKGLSRRASTFTFSGIGFQLSTYVPANLKGAAGLVGSNLKEPKSARSSVPVEKSPLLSP